MITSEVQHQFWITKKTVQRKLGSKEDEYIVSSDAELDAKIALLKSISETCLNLIKILEQYQEKLCILSQEECTFGRFLKEIGKRSKTTGLSITNSGKAIYFGGQQRISVRASIERLHHEVDVFRCRAISDTFSTVNNMEKERTEYRAALCWMKSLSTQLDPDNGKGLDKFRRAQAHVRIGKDNFDKLSMDCIQKIDLLTAARCNMFSHCLVAYVSAISHFSKKSESTFKVVANALTIKPQYDFYVLKDLSEDAAAIETQAADCDQSMFFSSEFKDTQFGSPLKKKETQKENILAEEVKSTDKIECNWFDTTEIEDYVTGLKVNNNLENLFNIGEGQTFEEEKLLKADKKNTSLKTPEMKEKDVMSWFNLFSELDPFENPQSFDSKLYSKVNTQQT